MCSTHCSRYMWSIGWKFTRIQNPSDIIAPLSRNRSQLDHRSRNQSNIHGNRLVRCLECVRDRRSSTVSAFNILAASSSIFRYISILCINIESAISPGAEEESIYIASLYITQSTIGSFAAYARGIIYFCEKSAI